jgi:copper resistance protein B
MGLAPAVLAGGADDPLLYKVMIDKLEVRKTGGPDPVKLDAQAWIGKDLDKFWVKTEAERAGGKTGEAEVQLLYSRAVAPFWDFQAGWRHDIKPRPDRDYLALGFQGLAPYLFELDTALFIGESGQVGARLDGEYEYLFTQRLVLSPELEVNLYRRNDAAVGIGSGLSDMELGLRLRYELTREFAPYIGVNWTRKFGRTADYADAEGEDTNDVQAVVGIRAWF